MDEKTRRLIDKYEADFEQLSSCDKWDKNQIEMMKDLQKICYYLEVRDAMKNGSEYSNNWNERSYANYAQLRNMNTGRFMPNGSGTYPMNYYDDMRGMSGRRYYDGEKEAVIHKLHRMMDTEDNPQKRMAIQEVIREFEEK